MKMNKNLDVNDAILKFKHIRDLEPLRLRFVNDIG